MRRRPRRFGSSEPSYQLARIQAKTSVGAGAWLKAAARKVSSSSGRVRSSSAPRPGRSGAACRGRWCAAGRASVRLRSCCRRCARARDEHAAFDALERSVERVAAFLDGARAWAERGKSASVMRAPLQRATASSIHGLQLFQVARPVVREQALLRRGLEADRQDGRARARRCRARTGSATAGLRRARAAAARARARRSMRAARGSSAPSATSRSGSRRHAASTRAPQA